MLGDDLKVLEKIANGDFTWSHHRAALQRIKEFVELAQQSTNSIKAEILPLAESIRICIKEHKYQYALNRVDDIVAKLSAV